MIDEKDTTAFRARMITATELAEMLHLSVDSVYRIVRKGGLPAYRTGRTIRFLASEVEAALAVNREHCETEDA